MASLLCKMLLLASASNTDFILKDASNLYFSIRRNNFLGSQGELLYVPTRELNLLSLHPAIFAALSVSSLFSAVFASPHFPVLYFFHQNERLGQGCSGYLCPLHPIAGGVRAEESSLLSVPDLQE